MPSTPHDARGLFASAVADPDPVLYYEHIALYRDPRLRQVLSNAAALPPIKLYLTDQPTPPETNAASTGFCSEWQVMDLEEIPIDEVARYIEWFTKAFEPILMAILGVSIGLVVVLMYMPIFELAGSIK